DAAKALVDAFNSGQPYVRKLIALEQALEADTVEVPREPTEAMWEAAEIASMTCDFALEDGAMPDDARQFPTARVWHLVCAYRAMLAAHEPEAREGEG